jgi:hypothetical protein
MSPYTKVAWFAIRLVAAGFIFVSVSLLSSDVLLITVHHQPKHLARMGLEVVPLLIGFVLAWKARAWATSLTRDLE